MPTVAINNSSGASPPTCVSHHSRARPASKSTAEPCFRVSARRSRGASQAVAPPQLPRVIDVLEAIAEAVSLAPAEARRSEAVTLLTHLLQIYGLPLSKYLEWVQVPEPKLQKALTRIRLVC